MKWVSVLSAILFLTIGYQPDALRASTDRTIEKSFPLTMGGRLSLVLETGGELEITGWDKPEISVTIDIGGDDADKADVEFDQKPSFLSIRSDCRKKRHVELDMRFTIKAPQRCDVRIDSKGGAITIEGIEGDLSGKTMGGALELTGVKGTIGLETMGGSVKVEDSEADGTVSTMGGSVLIRGVKGNLKGSTMGGTITYDNAAGEEAAGRSAAPDDKELHLSTMGGDLKIASTDKKVSGTTMGGDIDVGRAKEVSMTTMGGDISIGEAPAGAKVSTMGGDITIHSAGKHVDAKTMGGDIEIDAIDGRVKASTMGGDVGVTMVGDPDQGERDVEISSMGGDIALTVPAGLSMKFDIEIKYTKKHHRTLPRILSEFPMNIEETPEWDHNWLGQAHKHIYGTGSVGTGEHLIKIRTINGDVTIKKGI
jgi:hypothetical protein